LPLSDGRGGRGVGGEVVWGEGLGLVRVRVEVKGNVWLRLSFEIGFKFENTLDSNLKILCH
jgi:hypothetical protein